MTPIRKRTIDCTDGKSSILLINPYDWQKRVFLSLCMLPRRSWGVAFQMHLTNLHIVSWEPEGRYCCTMSVAIVPFWFSMEHLWIVIVKVPVWLLEIKVNIINPFSTGTGWTLYKVYPWRFQNLVWNGFKSQKDVNSAICCSLENQKGTITVKSRYNIVSVHSWF